MPERELTFIERLEQESLFWSEHCSIHCELNQVWICAAQWLR
jgi:hypothetical protein